MFSMSGDICFAQSYLLVNFGHVQNVQRSKKCLSGSGSRLSGGECQRRGRKERIRTEQVTDKERSTSVSVTDV